jgi:hypothetical protein
MQQAIWSIELEEHHGSPTNGGETNNEGILVDKMLLPGVLSWVKQEHKSATERIKSCEIRAFCTVARQTGRCQIVSLRLPTMFQRNDMINFMAIDRNVLGDQAVLTPLSRSIKHEVPQRRRD